MLRDDNLQTFTDPLQSYWLRINSKLLEYATYLFEIFKPWIGQEKLLLNTSTKVYYFNTLTQPILLNYAKLFYVQNKKVVPANISELLIPEGLAI